MPFGAWAYRGVWGGLTQGLVGDANMLLGAPEARPLRRQAAAAAGRQGASDAGIPTLPPLPSRPSSEKSSEWPGGGGTLWRKGAPRCKVCARRKWPSGASRDKATPCSVIRTRADFAWGSEESLGNPWPLPTSPHHLRCVRVHLPNAAAVVDAEVGLHNAVPTDPHGHLHGHVVYGDEGFHSPSSPEMLPAPTQVPMEKKTLTLVGKEGWKVGSG